MLFLCLKYCSAKVTNNLFFMPPTPHSLPQYSHRPNARLFAVGFNLEGPLANRFPQYRGLDCFEGEAPEQVFDDLGEGFAVGFSANWRVLFN